MALDDFFSSEFTAQTSIYFPAHKLVSLASPSPDKSSNCLAQGEEPGVMRGPCRAPCVPQVIVITSEFRFHNVGFNSSPPCKM